MKYQLLNSKLQAIAHFKTLEGLLDFCENRLQNKGKGAFVYNTATKKSFQLI